MASVRTEVVKTLSTKLEKKLANGYEKEMYKMCLDSWGQKEDWKNKMFVKLVQDIEYEKLGMLMTAKDKDERRAVLLDMRTNKKGWDSSVFNDQRMEVISGFEREAKPMEVADGVFTCYKCNGQKTTIQSIQLRSADEPMTNFITCVNCKNRWSC